jgi:hypothetical protein
MLKVSVLDDLDNIAAAGKPPPCLLRSGTIDGDGGTGSRSPAYTSGSAHGPGT